MIPDRDAAILQTSPEDLLAIFRQLARNPCEAQMEDDKKKRALLGKFQVVGSWSSS